ncbi:MAG: hypothetical protein BWK76_19680 [Desulfobulbaceae bacterium A2]|nr:MAG: hypothetical protein BWK76_19680 [Desulfobulbaceae bacterium A2]
MNRLTKTAHACAVLGALTLLAGCTGGQDFTYVPDNELKPGPGLVTGKEGAFTLVGPGGAEAPKKEGQTATEGK